MEARKRTAGRQITKDDAPEPEGEEESVGTWERASEVSGPALSLHWDRVTPPARPAIVLLLSQSSFC